MHVLRRVTKPGFPEYDVREIISPRSETIVYNITLFCDHVSLVLLELVKFSKERYFRRKTEGTQNHLKRSEK